MTDTKKTLDKEGLFDRITDGVGDWARAHPIPTSLGVLAAYDLAIKPGAKKVAGVVTTTVRGFARRGAQEVAKEHAKESARGFVGGALRSLNPFKR